MNFLQIVKRVHSETMRSTAAPATVADPNERHARIINRVADAWRDLQAERDWRWMRATLDVELTEGTQSYTGLDFSAADFGRWRLEDHTYAPFVYVTGYQNTLSPLAFRHLDAFRQSWVYRVVGQTRPLEWTYDEDNALLLGPIPMAGISLRIDYWKEPTELVNDSDEPSMPSRFHMYLVWKALIDCGKDDAAPEIIDKARENLKAIRSRLMLDQARLPSLL